MHKSQEDIWAFNYNHHKNLYKHKIDTIIMMIIELVQLTHTEIKMLILIVKYSLIIKI